MRRDGPGRDWLPELDGVGGVDPITGMGTTPAQRALYGAQAVLNATGLLGLTAGVGGVAKATDVVDPTAGSIKNVNPGYPDAVRTHNCVNCSMLLMRHWREILHLRCQSPYERCSIECAGKSIQL